MQCVQVTIKPESAFATEIKGDTLFGQFCWAIVRRYGSSHLKEKLAGYTENSPFAVFSDAYPENYIARPTMPATLLGFDIKDIQARKLQKQKQWMPIEKLIQPLNKWAGFLKDNNQVCKKSSLKGSLLSHQPQQHNSINRETGSTGNGDGFSPYNRQLIWFNPGLKLHIYIVFDSAHIKPDQLKLLLTDIGSTGYGKEATSGLGKFEVVKVDDWKWAQTKATQSLLTLAPCAPQGLSWQSEDCYYQPFTRFGKHGESAAIGGQPFKNPVLMTQTSALLTPTQLLTTHFCGQGLTGISKAIPATVQQGYAPVIPVALEGR